MAFSPVYLTLRKIGFLVSWSLTAKTFIRKGRYFLLDALSPYFLLPKVTKKLSIKVYHPPYVQLCLEISVRNSMGPQVLINKIDCRCYFPSKIIVAQIDRLSNGEFNERHDICDINPRRKC